MKIKLLITTLLLAALVSIAATAGSTYGLEIGTDDQEEIIIIEENVEIGTDDEEDLKIYEDEGNLEVEADSRLTAVHKTVKRITALFARLFK